MKKATTFILAVLVAVSMFAIPGTAENLNLTDGAVYPAYITGEANWTPVYISDNTNYSAANVHTATIGQSGGLTKAIIPSATNGNEYAAMYFHAGDATRMVGAGNTMDVGFKFKAPLTAYYKIDADVNMGAYDGTANADGMKIKIFNKEFVEIDDVTVTNEVQKYTETVYLEKDDEIFFFFNKNGTFYNDTLYARYLRMILQAPPLSEAQFPKPDISAFPALAGSSFDQFFNIGNEQGITALWRSFYVSEINGIEPLVKDDTYDKYVLPDKLQTGADVYAEIWEGIGNAFMPSDTQIIGDYFTAPAKGEVTVMAKLQYQTDPGSNPAAADGVNVTIYKNSISDTSKILDKTLVDFANSGASGKILKVDNVSVEAGDTIIFVYDKNGTIYSDSVKVLEKNVTYTKSESAVSVFTPNTASALFEGGKLKVLKTLTIQQALDAFGLNNNCSYMVLAAGGGEIADFSKNITEAASVRIYAKTGHYLIGSFDISAVTSLLATGGSTNNTPNNTNTSDVALLIALGGIMISVLFGTITNRKQKIK